MYIWLVPGYFLHSCPVTLLEVQCFHASEHDIPSSWAITSLNHQCKFVHLLRGKFPFLEGENDKFALENAEHCVSEACEITVAMLNMFLVIHSFMSYSNTYKCHQLCEKSAVRTWMLNIANNAIAELLLLHPAGLSGPSLCSNSWTIPKLHHSCVMSEVCSIPVEEYLFLLLHNTLHGWILIIVMGEMCQKAQNTSVPQLESN